MVESKKKLTPLGKEIKRKIIDKGLSNEELARIAGTTPSYLSQILYGYRSGEKYIHVIGKVLDIDINKYVA